MIIISQDKTMILNFEYIETIEIENPLENNDGKFKILCDTTSDNQYTIAEYKTEERAKEVLQEIIAVHQASKMFMATKGVLTQEEMCKAMIEQRKSIFKYEMPKE